MKGPISFTRHIRFYAALVCGVIAWAICRQFNADAALLAGGDVFYLVFLGFCIPLLNQKTSDLKKRAKNEDEGITVVVLITLATMAFFCVAVFLALSKKHDVEILPLALAIIGAPLGWLVLHTVMAFHYADLHFSKIQTAMKVRTCNFPGAATRVRGIFSISPLSSA